MSTDNNQVNNQNTEPNAQGTEKTFTQAELDSIVEGRIKREKEKYADYESLKEKAGKYDEIEEKSKSDLQKAQDKADKLQKELDGMKRASEIRNIRKKVAEETGVPEDLLTADTEEACKAQAEAMMKWKGPNKGYPSVKDGGAPQNTGGNKKTRDQFADWLNENN